MPKPAPFEPEAYFKDKLAIDSAASILSIVAWVVLVAGVCGMVFTIAKFTDDGDDAALIVAYLVPMGLLLALTWGVLYGLGAVIRAFRIAGSAPGLDFDEEEDEDA